jgi:hypothetical protein
MGDIDTMVVSIGKEIGVGNIFLEDDHPHPPLNLKEINNTRKKSHTSL